MKMSVTLILVLFLFANYASKAQKINALELKPVTSPVFVLMSVEPSTIDRPATAKALSMNLLSSLQSGTLPKDYAVEFAPYWFKPRFKATYIQDYGNVFTNAIRSLGISFATSTKDSVNTLTGIGVRTQFLRGKADLTKIPVLKEMQLRVIDLWDDTTGALEQLQDSIKIAAEQVMKRQGSFLELSIAASQNFKNGNFNENEFDKFGIWITYTYRLNHFDFLLMGRNISTNQNDELKNIQDAGFRMVWEKYGLTVSGEYVVRFQKDLKLVDDISKRISGYVEYKINDNLNIHYTFGQNFNTFLNNTLINQLGLNFGFGGNSPKL